MTQLQFTSMVLACGVFAGACTTDKNPGPDYGGSGSGSGSGDGSGDGSGSGSGSGGGVVDTDNNAGGPDVGADTVPTYPTAHPRIYLPKNKARLQAALAMNTAPAARFKNVVDRYVGGENIYGMREWQVALMGALTNDPKYCTHAVNAVDSFVASEEQKIAAAQQPTVASDSYLEVGWVIGDVAMTYDWCNASVSASQKTRWLAYANQAVWNVWHHDQAHFGATARPWSGWAVDDPANNYYYSFLRATAYLGLAAKGEDAQADTWIAQFRDTKMLGQLVPAFDAQLRGGGSREGTGYGVSMRDLFGLYDFWEGSTGEKLGAKTKHARQSMHSFMHQMMPTLDRFSPTGDQSRDSTAMFFDYQRNYLQELIALYPQDALAPRAKAMLDNSTLPVMARAELFVYDFLYDNAAVTAQPLAGMGTDYYASGIGHLYSRSGWDRQATWVELIGGPYTQSHAHMDQGSLMIYKEGWLGYDGVISSYSGIIQDTGSHSLVAIKNASGPVRQITPTMSQTVGVHAGSDWFYAAVDVTGAYNGNAAVSKVQREMVFLKPNVIVVYDRVATASGTTQTWQLVSPTQASIAGANATIGGTHPLKVQRLAPTAATSSVRSLASTDADYNGGYRFEEAMPGGDVRYLHVLSLDNAATSATASDDSTVTVTLGNGKTATIAFDRNNPGATLTYGGSTTTLTPTVDKLAD